MKSRSVQFRLAAVILLSAVLVSFAVTLVASAQGQPSGESSIRFLTGKDDELSYEYNISVPLRVAIGNFSTQTVTITADLVNMGFRKDPGQTGAGAGEQVEFLSATDVFTLPDNVSIGPGAAATLQFWPKSDVQLKSGAYGGFLSVRNLNSNELIYKPLTVTAPADKSGAAPEVAIEILSTGPLSYDYDDLKSGLDHIAIAVHNKGKDTAELTGNVVTDLVDKEGNSVDPIFTAEAPIKTVKSGEVAFLYLALAKNAKTSDELRHGKYDGFVVLTDQNGVITHSAFALAVPSASLAPTGEVSYDIVGIDATTPLTIDYQSLLENKETVAVAVENKGKEAINLRGDIVLDSLVDKSGVPLSLTFGLVTDSVTKTVEVKPGQVVFLNFELITSTMKAETSPKTGTYKGYVFIAAQEGGPSKHAPLILAVPSEGIATQKTYGTALVELLQGVSRKFSEAVFGQELELGVPALVLLIIVVGLVIRALNLRRARGRPGPVTIDPMVNATGDENIKTNGLDALMRDWLADVNLRPEQTKPFEDVQGAVGPLLAAVSVPGAQGWTLKTITDPMWGWLKPVTGHRVANTLRKGTGSAQYELVFEISEARTGKKTKTGEAKGETPEDAVEEAVARIYHHVMMDHNDVRDRIRPWERFSTPESILLYHQAKRLQASGDKKQAGEKYRQAATWEPYNIRIRLGTISILEGRKYLDTLVEYVRVVGLYPDRLETRHRLAVNLTFVDNLLSEWNGLKQYERDNLKKLLKWRIEDPNDKVFGSLITPKFIKDEKITGSDLIHWLENNNPQELEQLLLALARCQWACLEAPLSRFLMKYRDVLLNPVQKHYRDTFLNVVKLANYCTKLRLRSKSVGFDDLEQGVRKIVKPKDESKVSWQVYYTAACFYALAVGIPAQKPDSMSADEWNKRRDLNAKTAVKHLDLAYRDPDFVNPEWLFDDEHGDPDLKYLRRHPEYKHWKSIVRPVEEPKGLDEALQQKLDALCDAWDALAAGAAVEADAWEKHVEEVDSWKEVHDGVVKNWCLRQERLWRTLNEWANEQQASEPGGGYLRELFIDLTKPKTAITPNPGCRKGKEDTIETYKKGWASVAASADNLSRHWDERKGMTKAGILGIIPLPVGIIDVAHWAEEAHEVWQALADWARAPSKPSRKKLFEEKSEVDGKS